MSGYAGLILCFTVLIGLACVFTINKNDRMFFIVFLSTTIYYCVGALWYWFDYKGGYFVGVYWGDEIERAASVLAVSSASVMILIWFFISFFRRAGVGLIDNLSETVLAVPPRFYIFLKVGLIGACYVMFSSVVFGGLNKADSFVLIAYQFSDVLIPVIIFSVAVGGYGAANIMLILFFIVYATMAGLRYKLFLLLVPLMVGYIFGIDKKFGSSEKIKRMIIGGLSGIGLLALFSFMTTSRNKFEGIDFGSGAFSSLEDQLYGLFAESNIIYGLVAAIREFVDADNPPYAYFAPLIDSVLELLPKFLFPWRVTGLYYQNVAAGLLTEEAYNSGTTYPFIGEYIVMFGYLGLVFGCLCYSFVYFFCSNRLLRDGGDCDIAGFYGYGLLAAFFGYYAYSRGYIPQVFKGFLFVVLPYLSLVRQGRLLGMNYYTSSTRGGFSRVLGGDL